MKSTDIQYKAIDPDALEKREAYFFNISVLVPRPIAWVATIGPDGVPNCAPFSFFMGVSSHPPVLAFSAGARRTGLKDTVRNIESHPEFTVNICNEELADAMVKTADDLPRGQSEFDHAGLEPMPSDLIKVPRIGGAPVQMECRLQQLFAVPDTNATLILGRVVRYHIDPAVIDPKTGRADIRKLKPVGRLGGNEYCLIRDVFEIGKP